MPKLLLQLVALLLPQDEVKKGKLKSTYLKKIFFKYWIHFTGFWWVLPLKMLPQPQMTAEGKLPFIIYIFIVINH